MKLDTKTALGIDISNGRINLALLRKSSGGVELVKTATGPVPEGAIKNGNIEDPAILAKEISQLKTRSRIRVRLRQAAVSLVARPMLMQIMEMPKQAPTGVGQFVHNEVKHCVALSGKKIALDFCGIGAARQSSSNRVFVVAADSQKIAQIVKACTLARVNLEAIEPPLIAYVRAFYAKKIAGKFDRNVLIAELSSSALTLCVFRKQTMDFVRTREIDDQKAEPRELCQWVASEINTIIQFYDIEVPDSPGKWEISVVADSAMQLHKAASEILKAKIACESLQVETSEDAYQDTPLLKSELPISDFRLPIENRKSQLENCAKPSVVAIGLAMKLLAASDSNLRVNLLPRDVVEVKSLKKHALITANIIAAVLLVMVLAVGGLMLKIEKVNENIARKKQEQSLQDISELRREERLLDGRIKQLSEGPGKLNKILSSRHDSDWPGLLNDLRNRTPKTVCITNLKSSGNSRIFLEGLALSYESVHLFVNMLDESEHLDSASLIGAEKYGEGSRSAGSPEDGLVRYAINCSLTPEEGSRSAGSQRRITGVNR